MSEPCSHEWENDQCFKCAAERFDKTKITWQWSEDRLLIAIPLRQAGEFGTWLNDEYGDGQEMYTLMHDITKHDGEEPYHSDSCACPDSVYHIHGTVEGIYGAWTPEAWKEFSKPKNFACRMPAACTGNPSDRAVDCWCPVKEWAYEHRHSCGCNDRKCFVVGLTKGG